MKKPHWIKTSTDRGMKFLCSVCHGECVCLSTWSKYKKTNDCNYQYCPRCGIKMDLEGQTRMVKHEVYDDVMVEKELRRKETQ